MMDERLTFIHKKEIIQNGNTSLKIYKSNTKKKESRKKKKTSEKRDG